MTHPFQKAFDKISTHLLTQKVRAYDEDDASCAYRTEDGLKCAVGVLIRDGSVASEGQDVWRLNEKQPDLWDEILTDWFQDTGQSEMEILEFLSGLQRIHDDSVMTPNWHQELTNYALGYGLVTPPLVAA